MKYKLFISLIVLLSIGTGYCACYFYLKGNLGMSILLFFTSIILLFYTINSIFKILRDIEEFGEAVRYHDFSKRYSEKRGKKGNYYHYFNEISDVFLSLNQEKDTQQQYLKKMLELVDTGILAYEIKTNDALWMNDALKNMFNIPAIKNINWLRHRHNNLYTEITGLPLGDRRLITINSGNQTIKTLTNACTFQTGKKIYKLIAFHNINATLEEVEASAWKGLLSVMTHEIMNSIAPVSSLADTLKKRMESVKKEMRENVHADFEDIALAMETIQRRSEGLLKFANTYRNLSQTIVPQVARININEMINDIYHLMQPSLNQKNIVLETKTETTPLIVEIDRGLIEQTLINFITNATYAVKDKPQPQIIIFSGTSSEGNPYITVADNGCGIPSDMRDKIFIPFFSTKKNGSGIGLSLSREIVKLHKGTLQVQSKEGEGSAFSIVFNLQENWVD